MKLNLKRDFCLWLVPGQDGAVKKYRFTLSRALLVSSVVVGLLLGGIFVVGDYARVQILRVKGAITHSKLISEKSGLERQREELATKIRELEESQHRARIYERNVKERLSELAVILEGATSLLPVEPILESSAEGSGIGGDDGLDDSGVGGLEIDCVESGCMQGVNLQLLQRLHQHESNDRVPSEQEDQRIEGLVLSQMDQLIDLLKYLPLGYPGNGHINSSFGPRRSPFNGRMRMHQGIDIAMPQGSYIHSTGEGTVLSVRRERTYGLVIDVDHGRGIVTRYAHLSRAFVENGDEVCAGEVLGLAGSTGHSTGPHLHYEVRVDGKAVDPQAIIEVSRKLREVIETS